VGPIAVRIGLDVDGHRGHILGVHQLLDVLNGELPLLRLCTELSLSKRSRLDEVCGVLDEVLAVFVRNPVRNVRRRVRTDS
jgi:hypothetical protein